MKRILSLAIPALVLAAVFVVGCNNSPGRAGVVKAQTLDYGTTPTFDVGLSVDQAYQAIPHRRTVWNEADSSASPAEKIYLKTIFELLDQAIAVRVAGMQNYAAGHSDYSDPDAEYEQLIAFAQSMTPPSKLATYHSLVLQGLTNQRQFFTEWKAKTENFGYPNIVSTHPAVQRASGALRSAYQELIRRFPAEGQTNKDAFFDYHCALDFL